MSRHERYLQQAAWTRPLRQYLLDRTGFGGAQRILEVGCGTGAILADLAPGSAGSGVGATAPSSPWTKLERRSGRHVHGLDVDAAALYQCHQNAPGALLACGNALALPYRNSTFDVTCCHYVLLWVIDPLQALLEMKRVTRVHGQVLALAEPDYSARVDKPSHLAALGCLQNRALKQQGADLNIGSRLGDLFQRAGLHLLEFGTIGERPRAGIAPAEYEAEWKMLEEDLAFRVAPIAMAAFRLLDRKARGRGERDVHVPTYFAWGQV